MRTNKLRLAALALILAGGCRVYNPDLVSGRDAIDTIEADAAALDVHDAGDVVSERVDATDARDIAIDAGPSCEPVLAMGRACIEPFSGQTFSPDDPRLIAPQGVAVSPTTPPRIVAGDIGSGRIMSYAADGSDPRRVAGTGTIGIAVADGIAIDVPITSPSAMVYLPGGELVVADPVAHALYRLRSGRWERFGTWVFQDGPWALALVDPVTLLVAADNQVYSMPLSGGAPAMPMAIIGRSCGVNCRGYNSSTVAGLSTSLNGPTGLDFDAQYIYIADSQNCRIRRARRNDPMSPFSTSLLAGQGCDRNSDILTGGSGGTIAATAARLGPVGDVRVGSDGTVYFTDPEAHCAVLSVNTMGVLRVVAGSSVRCGEPGVGGVALGRLGGLGISDDRNTLYFVDQQHHRIGVIRLNAPGGPSVPSFPIAPGDVPGTMTAPEQVRVGGVSGLAVDGSASAPVVYWAGAAEGRIYRAQDGMVSVLAGNGHDRLITAIQTDRLEPNRVLGLDFARGQVLMGLPEHAVVASAMGSALVPIAGVYDRPGNPVLMGAAASSEALNAPAWPTIHGSDLYFVTAPPGARVFRVDGASRTNPLRTIAGVGPGVDAGAPPVDGGARADTVTLGRPSGLAFDRAGNMYVADPDNNVVWRVRADGTIEVAAGMFRQNAPLSDDASDARSVALLSPWALAFDGMSTLYIADRDALRIRALDLTSNMLRTVAGSGPAAPALATSTGDYGDATRATLAQPTAIAFSNGRLYIGEYNTGRVRVVRLP